jgi:hypothetical protein
MQVNRALVVHDQVWGSWILAGVRAALPGLGRWGMV